MQERVQSSGQKLSSLAWRKFVGAGHVNNLKQLNFKHNMRRRLMQTRTPWILIIELPQTTSESNLNLRRMSRSRCRRNIHEAVNQNPSKPFVRRWRSCVTFVSMLLRTFLMHEILIAPESLMSRSRRKPFSTTSSS